MGGLSLVSGPALDVVSLAEARVQVKEDLPDNDGLIAGYILAARRACELHTGRSVCNQTFDFTLDYGWPPDACCMPYWPEPGAWPGSTRRRILLPIAPLVSVSSVKYLDVDGVEQTLDPAQYRVVTRSDRARGFVEPAFGVSWPAVRPVPEAITVRFIAGYGDQPGQKPDQDVFRQAMLLLIAHWFRNREAVVIGQAPTELPLGFQALLAPLVIDGLL